MKNHILLTISKLDNQSLKVVFVTVGLVLFVLGAAAPHEGGGH